MMDYIRCHAIKAKTEGGLRLNEVEKQINEETHKEWFNSLSPEGKLIYVYERLGFENNAECLRRQFEKNPEKYLKQMEVVKGWKL